MIEILYFSSIVIGLFMGLPVMLLIVRSKYKTDLIEVESPHSTKEHWKSIANLIIQQVICHIVIILVSLPFEKLYILLSFTNLVTQILSLSAIHKYKFCKTKKQMKQLRIYCSLTAFPGTYVSFLFYPIIMLLDKLKIV